MSVPELVIRIPLEGTPRVEILADSYEDERRVRLWFSRSGVLRRVLDDFERIVERLQTYEREEVE